MNCKKSLDTMFAHFGIAFAVVSGTLGIIEASTQIKLTGTMRGEIGRITLSLAYGTIRMIAAARTANKQEDLQYRPLTETQPRAYSYTQAP
jgi:hypothetical protein